MYITYFSDYSREFGKKREKVEKLEEAERVEKTERIKKGYKAEQKYRDSILLYIPFYFFFFCDWSDEVSLIVDIIKWSTSYAVRVFHICSFLPETTLIETEKCLTHS